MIPRHRHLSQQLGEGSSRNPAGSGVLTALFYLLCRDWQSPGWGGEGGQEGGWLVEVIM